jgi:hypothetical protein
MDSENWYRIMSAYKHEQAFWVKALLLIKITNNVTMRNFKVKSDIYKIFGVCTNIKYAYKCITNFSSSLIYRSAF